MLLGPETDNCMNFFLVEFFIDNFMESVVKVEKNYAVTFSFSSFRRMYRASQKMAQCFYTPRTSSYINQFSKF